MIEGILGKKIGMTQIFDANGTVIPVTIVQAGPCLVVAKRTQEKDGYEAVQLGLVEKRVPRKVTKALKGHFGKAGVTPTKQLQEFRLDAGATLNVGDKVLADIFQPNDMIDIVGVSRGKGFQGVVKRHGFAGGRATHGSMFHRAPGSIGASAFPSRVMPGMRAGGRMGGERVTVKNLMVARVDTENNLIYVRGAVPGGRNTTLRIRRAQRG